ncbi:MAG: universal stress protein [Bacteroidota bacterium]|nr:universal stress protein [Bacteroidota bacterium]
MKSFLVAIDFSNCSVNALMHAAQLAHLTNARIEMIWVNNPAKTKVSIEDYTSTELIDEINDQFKQLANKLQDKYIGLNVDYLIREGKVYKEVKQQALESSSQLIVAGTHGKTGLEKFWIGSNVYRIVSTAPCPVLTVRTGVNVNDRIDTIVMPIDSTMETREKVTITGEIAQAIHAKVVVLKLYSKNMIEVRDSVDIYAEQVVDYLREEGVEVDLDVERAANLTETTIDYAKRTNANLIVIMTEQEKKVTNFLIGNYAHQMINTSPLPVISVRPRMP